MSPIIELIGGAKAYGWSALTSAPNSFESIATVSVPSNTSEISFTSIPQTYKHLQIRASYINTLNLYSVKIEFNGDATNNYNEFQITGTGSGTPLTGAGTSTSALIGIGAINTNLYTGAMICDILDYKNTNKLKTVRSLTGADGNGSGQIKLCGPLWRSTNAISTIRIHNDGSNFKQYSHFALYGIKG
jgi:hypothetical protein